VSGFARRSTDGRRVTTARARRSAQWQRCGSAGAGSEACGSRAATAVRAAVAASAAWPSPSTTAMSAPVGTGLTRDRSPDSVWPGSADAATPQSIRGEASTDASRIHAPPLFHRHGGSLPRIGNHVEVVHEAPGPGQPETEAPGRGVAVLQGAGHVADPGPLVARHHHDALTVAVRDEAEGNFDALGVYQVVACDLGDGGRDDRMVGARESCLGGQVATPLPRSHDIAVGGDWARARVSTGLS